MAMIASKPELAAMAEALYASCLSLNRGDVLPYERVDEATGMDRELRSWWTVVRKLRRLLLSQRGIQLRALPNYGLRLLTVQEQIIESGEHRQRRALRQLRRGRNEVSAVPNEEMSLYLMTTRDQIRDDMRKEEKKLRGHLAVQAVMLRQESLPR